MKSICLFIYFMSFSFGCLCQMNINGKLLDRSVENKYIFLYVVHKFSEPGALLDSIPVSSDGSFNYSVPGNYIPGTLFKITGKTQKDVSEFPQNALLFIYEKKGSISMSIKSLSHLYLAEYKSESRTNISVSTLQKMQFPYFERVELFMKSKQGRDEREAFFADLEKFRASFIRHLQDFQDNEKSPLVNLPMLYFYCKVNYGQLNDSLSIAKFDHLELPATDLAESLKHEFEKQSINAFDKAISAYTLLDSNKNEFALPVLFKAKYTVVDLWASWCPPCRNENKNEVRGFIKKLSQLKEVDFVAISMDTDSEKWERAVKDDNIIWKSFLLKNEEKKVLPQILNGNGIPYYLIYDQNGKAVYGSRYHFHVYSYLQKINRL